MGEIDDRLAGDLVWELFSHPSAGGAAPGPQTPLYQRCIVAAGLIALARYVSPAMAVVAACLVVSARDLASGRYIGQLIPDKAGGAICAWFTYAWGAWKFGAAGFALMFLSIAVFASAENKADMPPAFFAALLAGAAGFIVSAAITALGLVASYRSGMRIWIGEGVNQARTLLAGMLVVIFAFVVLGPLCVWLARISPRANDSGASLPMTLIVFGCMLGGPVVILLVLDRIGRRVIADRPGKFGPKVPTVGKWN